MSATMTHIDKKNTLAPKLRFKDKSGKQFPVWEEKKLGAISKIYDGTHQTPTYVSEGIPFYSVEHITANQFTKTKYITQEVFDKENEKVRLEKGDILMTKIGDIGTSKLIDWDVKASFYVSLALIKQSDSFSSKYLNQYIASRNFQLELWKRIIHVAFPKKINLGEIGNCHVKLPTLPEQQKIASFLSAVDEKLQQLTRKKQLLEQYKKGVMQQLFSGKLRFKDENGKAFPKWEEKRLGDVAIIKMGQSPDSKSYNTDSVGMLLIQGNADINGRVTNPRQWTSEPTKICEIGDLILTVRAPVGSISKSLHHACLGRGVCSIKNNKTSDIEFLFQFLLGYEDKWKKIEQGSTFTAVNGNEINSLKLNVPSLPEQKKIATYLSNIDNKIENVNKQITQTQTFKKGLLQQMFI